MSDTENEEYTSGNSELDDVLAGSQGIGDDQYDDDTGEEELDLSEEGPTRDFTPFKGKHLAVLVKARNETATSSGRRQVACEAVIVDGDHKNQHVWFYVGLSGGGVWFTRLLVEALGFELDSEKPRIVSSEWLGIPFWITTKIVPARGQFKAKTEAKGFDRYDGDFDPADLP